MKNVSLLCLIAVLCVACTSRPPEVFASRPLVEEAQTQGGSSIKDANLDAFFSGAQVGSRYSNGDTELLVLAIYSSALGNSCVQYDELEAASSTRKVACKDNPSWVVYPWMSSGISNYQGGV
jgi:hypothetical protein